MYLEKKLALMSYKQCFLETLFMYIICTNEEFLMSLLNLRGRCFVYFGSEYLHTMRSGYSICFSQFLSKILSL